VLTGRLFTWQRVRFDRYTLIRFYNALQAAYPDADEIFLVQDNWPVHHHPDIQVWVKDSNITILFLPTYAPWTNPIEHVWLRLRQDVLHLHSYADDWQAIQHAVQRWLDQYAHGSQHLLQAVGLSPY
jgi:putative transposase